MFVFIRAYSNVGMDLIDNKLAERKIKILAQTIIVAACSYLAYLLKTDYGYVGVVAIILFYVLRENKF